MCPIISSKSLSSTFFELCSVFSPSPFKRQLSASQIQAEWSYHVELVIEPVGWQALWKIPRLVLLEGITIDAGDLRAVVIVRAGITKILNCVICASNQSIVKLGVVVLPNAKLIIEDTVFDGLGTAVVIYNKGEVYMNNCSFKNCVEGVQLYDSAKLVASSCFLGQFKEYALRLETQKHLQGMESKCGGTELLEGISGISLKECNFADNGKGNVVLKPGTAFASMKQDGTVNTET